MTGTCGPQGWASEVAVQKGATFNTSGTPFHFIDETIEQRDSLRIRDVKTGSRGVNSALLKGGLQYTMGQITCEPTPNMLAVWLELIMGGTPAGNVFDFAKGIPEFILGKNLDSDAYTYAECKVNRAVFEGRSNGQLTLALDIVGGVEADVTWPVFTTPVGEGIDDQAYGFEESVLTLNSNIHDMFYFKLQIDNFLVPQFVNSTTPTRWCPGKNRQIGLQVTLPFASTDELNLYNTTQTTEIDGSIAFTNGTVSTTFTFPNIRNPRRTPKSRGKGEITHTLGFIATDDAAANALTVTNDSTP